MISIVDSHLETGDVVDLVKSFHKDMKARVKVDGELKRRLK